jgi:hypothetical protein
MAVMSGNAESVITRIVSQKRPSPPLPEPEPDHPAFSTVNTAPRQRHIMLDLRKKNGTRLGLSYAYLHSVAWNPSASLVLTFSGQRIEITGLRLEPLYDALLAHHVGRIHEGDELHAEAGPEVTIVTSITID